MTNVGITKTELNEGAGCEVIDLDSYRAQRDYKMLRDIPTGWHPGRPSVGISVWAMKEWDFFINALSEEVLSWVHEEREFSDTTSIDQSIDSNEFGARTRYPFGYLSIYKVPERPCQPHFNAWTPGHKGRIVLAATCPGPSFCIEIIDFEVGKVLNSGEFTVSVWGYASIVIEEDTYFWIGFDREKRPLKVECSLFEKSLTIDPAAFAWENKPEGVAACNLELLLWGMLEAGALS